MSGIYIPDMTEEEYIELCAWARVGANNCYLGRKECIPVPDHGRLIDADKTPFLESENGCQDDYAFRDDINEMPTIIPASGGAE